MKLFNKNSIRLIPYKITLASILISIFSISHATPNSDYLSELENEADTTKVEKSKIVKTVIVKSKKPRVKKNIKKKTYLDGLSAEANKTNVDNSSIISTKALKESARSSSKVEHWDINTQNLGTLRPNLKWKEFESILKDNYFASYVFYKKLDPTSKNLVYKDYKNSPNIDHIRAKIISLSRR